MSRAPKWPLVAVVGATGTGKSDLAIEIAKRFNGEVVNGDAMQLYEGLPIITNKVTKDEMQGVPHHLLGCIGLEEETWTVGMFVTKALSVIDGIRARGKLPVLVGGTHYYTQSLLFHDALIDEPLEDHHEPASQISQEFPILEEPTAVILERLEEVDPIMAYRWHPNDRRKIQRSLEIYLKTGKPASQVYEEQHLKKQLSSGAEGKDAGPSLRCSTLLFWVHASRDTLHKRTDTRILKMLDKGLLEEVATLSAFRDSYQSSTGTSIDQTRGIWVSIGYKEFLEYQAALSRGSASASELEALRLAAVEKMQAATRQFSNRQVRWIRIKLLNALTDSQSTSNLFLLDGTQLEHWNKDVVVPATQITEKFLSGLEVPRPMDLSDAAGEMLQPKREYDLSQRRDMWQQRTCDLCGVTAVTVNEWQLHVKSRGHRRAVGTQKKQQSKAQSEWHRLKAKQTELVDTLDFYQGSLSNDDHPK